MYTIHSKMYIDPSLNVKKFLEINLYFIELMFFPFTQCIWISIVIDWYIIHNHLHNLVDDKIMTHTRTHTCSYCGVDKFLKS